MSNSFGEELRKLVLAGIGAVAETQEKAKDLVEDLVKKGELTVEEGKIFNEELKHKVKTKIKDDLDDVIDNRGKPLSEKLDEMTDDELAELKRKLAEMEENGVKKKGETSNQI